MIYKVKDRYDLFDTAEECATKAAKRFTAKKWRWRQPYQAHGRIPNRAQILDCLLNLQRHARNDNCESGRLIFYHGKFGVEKPVQPHPLVHNEEK